MEFPPLDGLKLWHLLQTHVSAGCGETIKVTFDGLVILDVYKNPSQKT